MVRKPLASISFSLFKKALIIKIFLSTCFIGMSGIWNYQYAQTAPVKFIYQHEKNIYMASQERVYVSNDNGTSWKELQLKLPKGAKPESLKTNGLYWFVDTEKDRYLFSEMGSDYWARFDSDYAPNTVGVYFDGRWAIRENDKDEFKYSYDSGKSWLTLDKKVSSVTIMRTSGKKIFVSTYNDGVVVSLDGADSFKKTGKGLEKNNYGYIIPLTTLAIKNNELYGCSNKTVYRSLDDGASWKAILNRETDPLLKIACNGAYLFAATGTNGVLISPDNGVTWTESNNGLSAKKINCILANDSFVFVGTDAGTFYSANNGGEWAPLSIAPYSAEAVPDNTPVAKSLIKEEVRAEDNKNANTTTLVMPSGHAAADRMNNMSFSEDGRYLLTGTYYREWIVWDLKLGKELLKTKGAEGELINKGQNLIIADFGTINMYDLNTGNVVRKFSDNVAEIKSMAISKDQKLMYAGGNDGVSRLWDISSGKLIRKFVSQHRDMRSVKFSTDDKYLQMMTWDNSGNPFYNVFETATGREINDYSSISFRSKYNAKSVEAEKVQSANGDVYAQYADPQKLQAVNVFDKGGNLIRTISIKGEEIIPCFALSPNGRYLAIGNSNESIAKKSSNAVIIYEVYSGKVVREFRRRLIEPTEMALSADGRYLVTNNSDEITRTWDLYTGKPAKILAKDKSNSLGSMVFSPDGRFMITSRTFTVSVWDLITGEKKFMFDGCEANEATTDFSKDGKYLLFFRNFGYIGICELATGKVTTVNVPTDGIAPKAVSLRYDNNETVAVVTMKREKEFNSTNPDIYYTSRVDIITGKSLDVKKEYGDAGLFRAGTYSPDGKMVATGDVQVKIWNTQTGKLISNPYLSGGKVLSFAFTPDGQYLAAGFNSNEVKVWETATGNLVSFMRGHVSSVTAVRFERDGKRLYSGSLDGTIKVWDVQTGKEIVTLAAFGDKQFLIKTPENYFYASREAYKLLAFRVGNKTFPFEQFDLKLNRPDIVLERLGKSSPELIGSFKNAYRKRLKKLKFTEDMLAKDYHVPELALLNTNVPYSTTLKSYVFNLGMNDSLYLLDRLKCYVNDVPVYGSKGLSLREKHSKYLQQEVTIELSNGDNKIQFSVINEKGAESVQETFTINYTGQRASPDLYVVTIGISDYTDNEMDLRYAAKDAKDLAALYAKATSTNKYGSVKTLSILDKDATRENILKAKDFLGSSKVDDEVLIFVAAHGLLDDNLDYYIATTDVDFNNPATKGLLYDDFEGMLDYVAARSRLIMIDACHSGEVDKEGISFVTGETRPAEGNVTSRGFKPVVKTEDLGLTGSFELMQEVFADLSKGSGSMVISSASGIEFAFESQEWQNGVFTFSVLEGIKTMKADTNRDKKINVSELRDYVMDRVEGLTNGKQHPTSRKENLEFDFVVW